MVSTLRIASSMFIIVLSVSVASIIVKLVSAPASVIAFWRLLFSLIIVTSFYAIKEPLTLISILKDRSSLYLSILSGIMLALHLYTWMLSLKIIDVYVSTTIVCLHPIITLLLARIVLKEEVGFNTLIGVSTATIGSALTALSKVYVWGITLTGSALSLIGAFFMSCYVTIGRFLRRRLSLGEYIIPTYSSATLTLLFIAVAEDSCLTCFSFYEAFLLLLLAVGPMIGGHTLLNYILRFVKASIASIPIVLEPIGASLLAAIMIGEKIPPLGFVGVALTSLGLLIIFLTKRRG